MNVSVSGVGALHKSQTRKVRGDIYEMILFFISVPITLR